MKTVSLLFLVGYLSASTPAQVLSSLEKFPAQSTVKKTLHFESRIDHPSQPKEPSREARQDLGVRFENGELWSQKISNSDQLTALELHEILDPRPLLRSWMNGQPTDASSTSHSDHLVFQVLPKVPSRLKRLWESEGRLEIWLAQDGSPSRARLVQRYKGRAQRIAPTEEVKFQANYTFKAEGDHLLVTTLEEDREESVGYDIQKRHRLLELRD